MEAISYSEPILYLIPVEIDPANPGTNIPGRNLSILQGLDEFIVENVRTARRFLRSMGYTRDFDEVKFHELNKHTLSEDISSFLKGARNGLSVGLMSEAGSPCIADPGNVIVSMAHKLNIRVVPLVGPSSILLALIASGFNGQHFIFHGYLPLDKHERNSKLKKMQGDAERLDQTQIFMETPFRNNALMKDLLGVLDNTTLLCVAAELNSENEFIYTQSIADWKKNTPDLNKKPGVFLIYRSK